MAHGVKLEIAEGDLLHLAIGGVIVDPVLVAAETVARVQHRRMLVGDPRQLVEPAAGQCAEPVEMRLEPREIVRRQIKREQIAQAAVDGVEILSRTIGRDVIGAATRMAAAFAIPDGFVVSAHPWLASLTVFSMHTAFGPGVPARSGGGQANGIDRSCDNSNRRPSTVKHKMLRCITIVLDLAGHLTRLPVVHICGLRHGLPRQLPP